MLKSFKQFKTLIITLLVLVGSSYVFAAPASPPSEGLGVYPPLTVGPEAQTKTGKLTVGELCLGTDCRPNWPRSGLSTDVGVASGAQNLTCLSGMRSINQIYYYYGSDGLLKDSGIHSYQACTQSFTITTPALPGKPLSLLNYKGILNQHPDSLGVKCWTTYSGYSYNNTPVNSSAWLKPTDLSVSFNASNQLVITGKCLLRQSDYGSGWGVAEASIDVRYIL